jgi:hypothetical protein
MTIRKLLELSTGNMPSSKPDFGTLHVLDFEEGYAVFVVEQELYESMYDGLVPDWFKPINAAAKEEDCLFVLFDRDADVDDRFPEYDW